MALTNAQICSVAQQISKTPGFSTQAGYQYNAILEELAESYDFDIQKVTNFSITTNTAYGTSQGPYNLPADYLRSAKDERGYDLCPPSRLGRRTWKVSFASF